MDEYLKTMSGEAMDPIDFNEQEEACIKDCVYRVKGLSKLMENHIEE